MAVPGSRPLTADNSSGQSSGQSSGGQGGGRSTNNSEGEERSEDLGDSVVPVSPGMDEVALSKSAGAALFQQQLNDLHGCDGVSAVNQVVKNLWKDDTGMVSTHHSVQAHLKSKLGQRTWHDDSALALHTTPAKTKVPRKVARLRRSNSTSSIYINSTMTVPDGRGMLMQVSELVCELLNMNTNMNTEGSPHFSTPFDEPDESARFWLIDAAYVQEFLTHAFEVAELPLDCLVYSLVYLERFLTLCGFQLMSSNFRPVMLVSLLLATKMCDDRGMYNEDFAWMFPGLCNTRTLNLWEHLYVSILNWDFYVSASTYAVCYFRLQHMLSKKHFQSSTQSEVALRPLDMDSAMYLHAVPLIKLEWLDRAEKQYPKVRAVTPTRLRAYGYRSLSPITSPQDSPKNQLSPRSIAPGSGLPGGVPISPLSGVLTFSPLSGMLTPPLSGGMSPLAISPSSPRFVIS